MKIRLVTFDALGTSIIPRKPIERQYADVFRKPFGELSPKVIKKSFSVALKELQAEKPNYRDGHEDWWKEVIRRTAIGAGAAVEKVDENLDIVTRRLLNKFSSSDGYRLVGDAAPIRKRLNDIRVGVGLITNADSRMRSVFNSLQIKPTNASMSSLFSPILISEEVGVEKPDAKIFLQACQMAGVQPSEAVHVGDELKADYWGAKNAGLHAFLLKRNAVMRNRNEDLTGVDIVHSLNEVYLWVKKNNETA
ncbi:HAD superfamily protein [Abortiporus biennis]